MLLRRYKGPAAPSIVVGSFFSFRRWNHSGVVLEWVAWDGVGIRDSPTGSVNSVVADVKRELVNTDGAAKDYGFAMKPQELTAIKSKSEAFRAELSESRRIRSV